MQSAVDRNNMASGLSTFVTRQPDDGGSAMLRQNGTSSKRALGVEISEFVAEFFGSFAFGKVYFVFLKRPNDAVARKHR